MFRCNHCKTEYGGIRGVSGDICPRCIAQNDGASRAPSAPSMEIAPTPWDSLQLAVSSRPSLSSPRRPYAIR